MSGPNLSHRQENRKEIHPTQDETKSKAKFPGATDSCVLGVSLEPAVAPTSQQLQPLQSTNPEHTTHWEPSGSTPGPHLFDPQGHEVSSGPFRPGGRRPIVARLRRANGLAYGRPDTLDLRSFADLKPSLSTGSAMHFIGFVDRGGMERNPSSEPFFTESTLADYLAVSDRTIRNRIRNGDLPSYKLGAARRIDPADVEDFLARHRDKAT